ncbi:hypothetical protein N9L68_02670 [bacterium]|nr:hypothetical protein [bacterium]
MSATTDPTALCAAPAMGATDPAENPTTPCAAPAPAGVVAHTFIYVRGNTSETTLQLYDNKLVSSGSNEPLTENACSQSPSTEPQTIPTGIPGSMSSHSWTTQMPTGSRTNTRAGRW